VRNPPAAAGVARMPRGNFQLGALDRHLESAADAVPSPATASRYYDASTFGRSRSTPTAKRALPTR
jgi:hypothetical protein